MSSGHHRHHPDSEWRDLRPEVQMRLADPEVHKRIWASYRVDQSYDIAYVAGISNDGLTLYADRQFPLKALVVGERHIDVTPFLWLHESGEKSFIELYHDHYFRAHKLITIAEHDAVVRANIDWQQYSDAFDIYDKRDEHENIKRSPPDLFLRPYQDSGDWHLLNRIQATMA